MPAGAAERPGGTCPSPRCPAPTLQPPTRLLPSSAPSLPMGSLSLPFPRGPLPCYSQSGLGDRSPGGLIRPKGQRCHQRTACGFCSQRALRSHLPLGTNLLQCRPGGDGVFGEEQDRTQRLHCVPKGKASGVAPASESHSQSSEPLVGGGPASPTALGCWWRAPIGVEAAGESRTEQACLGLPHDLEPLAQGAFPSSAASGPCSHSRAPPLLSQLRACTVEGLALRPFRSLPRGHTAAPVPTDFIETPVSPVTLALRPLPSLSRIPSRASQFRLCAQGRPV